MYVCMYDDSRGKETTAELVVEGDGKKSRKQEGRIRRVHVEGKCEN